MSKRSKECCPAPEPLRVEAIVAVDERGQMVLPKSIRDRFGLEPGEKLAVVTREQDGKVCCLYMFKAGDLVDPVKDRFGPLLGEG